MHQLFLKSVFSFPMSQFSLYKSGNNNSALVFPIYILGWIRIVLLVFVYKKYSKMGWISSGT